MTINRYTLFPLFPLFFCGAIQAKDSPLTLVAAISYQDRLLDFDQQYSGAAQNQAQFDVHLPMLSGALTAIEGRWFFTAKIEQSVSGVSTSTSETDRSAVLESNLIAVGGSGLDVERKDVTFTIGYNVREDLNMFVGYLDGETELTPDPFCANPIVDDESVEPPCSRSNRAFQQFYLGDNGFVDNQRAYQQIYSESGYYVGFTYTKPVKSAGSLSFNVAYASMDGEYRDNANDPNNAFGGTFVPFHYEGDTTGTSIALTWSGSLGSTAAYFFDFRRQQYEMDGEDKTGLLTTVSLKTVEEMVGISMGVRFYF